MENHNTYDLNVYRRPLPTGLEGEGRLPMGLEGEARLPNGETTVYVGETIEEAVRGFEFFIGMDNSTKYLEVKSQIPAVDRRARYEELTSDELDGLVEELGKAMPDITFSKAAPILV